MCVGSARTETLYCLWRLAYSTTSVPRAMAALKYSLQPLRPLSPLCDIAWHDVLARFCQPLIGFRQDPAEHAHFLTQHAFDVTDVLYMVGAAIERMTEIQANDS